LGVVAKLAEGPDPAIAARQVRGEVAAWFLACELGWDDLVPVTTLGVAESRFTGQHVAASLQVVWPRFKVAAELQREPASCGESDRWRVAIFDALAGNTDRNATNWGFIEDLQRPKLIDNGNGFDVAPTTSQFSTELNGQPIPDDYKEPLGTFVASSDQSQLKKMLPDPIVTTLFGRAQSFVQKGTFDL
jgi:hypothetical protein